MAQLVSALADAVALEDPWNGELTVRLIDKPFIDPERDTFELMSWRL